MGLGTFAQLTSSPGLIWIIEAQSLLCASAIRSLRYSPTVLGGGILLGWTTYLPLYSSLGGGIKPPWELRASILCCSLHDSTKSSTRTNSSVRGVYHFLHSRNCASFWRLGPWSMLGHAVTSIDSSQRTRVATASISRRRSLSPLEEMSGSL